MASNNLILFSFSIYSLIYCHGSDELIKVAPGEGKIPTNCIREQHEDANAFPRNHSPNFDLIFLSKFLYVLYCFVYKAQR